MSTFVARSLIRQGLIHYNKSDNEQALNTFKAVAKEYPVTQEAYLFAGRRRHTSWTGDWSSEVCSSDLGRLGNPAIRTRPYIQQQRSVLAHDIDQLMDQRTRRAEFVALDVSPGLLADRCVGLPEQRPQRVELAALDIQHRGTLGKRFLFVVDGHAALPLDAAVVIESRELLEIWLEDRLFDPPVEPQEFGLILIDNLRRARQPVVQVRFIGLRLLRLRRS